MSSRSSMSTNPAAKRVQVDLAKFQADHAAHRMFHIEPAREDGDLFTLKGHVYGPPGTPYQGGVFHLEMTIPPTYPFQSPTVRMTTKVWHPNIGDELDSDLYSTYFFPRFPRRRIWPRLPGHSEQSVDRRHVHLHDNDEHSGAALLTKCR